MNTAVLFLFFYDADNIGLGSVPRLSSNQNLKECQVGFQGMTGIAYAKTDLLESLIVAALHPLWTTRQN
jgi:hypothetical protein